MCENDVKIVTENEATETKKGFFDKVKDGAKAHAPQIAKAAKVAALGGLCFALGVNVGKGTRMNDVETVDDNEIVDISEDDDV